MHDLELKIRVLNEKLDTVESILSPSTVKYPYVEALVDELHRRVRLSRHIIRNRDFVREIKRAPAPNNP